MFIIMKAKYWLLVLALVTFVAFPGKGMAATILLEDNFDAENGSSAALNYTGFSNWNVTDGSVDLIGSGSPWNYRPGNGLYVDLDGSTGNAGRLESMTLFALNPGAYELRYDISGSVVGSSTSLDTVTVGLGSIFSSSVTFPPIVPFVPMIHTFSVPSLVNGRLYFDHDGGDNIGLLLDNVKLTYLDEYEMEYGGDNGGNGVEPVPEPATIALMGIGLVGLAGGAARRKWKKKAVDNS